MANSLVTMAAAVLAATAFSATTAAAAPQLITVAVNVEVAPAKPGTSFLGAIEAIPLAARDEAATRTEAKAQIPGDLTLSLRSDIAWRLSLAAPGYWAEPVVLTPKKDMEPVRLIARPTGQLTGSLKMAANEPLPKELTVRFQSPPGSPPGTSVPEASVVCPVREQRFSCDVPAARLDVRLRAKGFVSHFLWDLPVKIHATQELGVLTLQRGASLAGWVAAADGAVTPRSCRVWVEGTVQLGDEPLSAEVYFGGRYGAEKMILASDEEGRFAGYLPRKGRWPLYVEAEEQAIRRSLPPREVYRRKGARAAFVEIELPDTELAGVVVDEAEDPVAGALVNLYEDGVALQNATLTDEEGRFLYRGLAEGRCKVFAESSAGSSEEVEVDLAEERKAPELQLVLRERKTLSGRVLSASGGVPAALVWATLFREGDGALLQRVEQATTDVTGAFELKVPASAGYVQFTAFPPGSTLTIVPAAPLNNEPVTLQSQPNGGSLTLELETPIDWSAPQTLPSVFVDGVAVSLFTLRRWADVNNIRNSDPQRFLVPQLPAGSYAVCRPLQIAGPATTRPREDCVQGDVAPFSELTLRLPR